MAKGSATAVSKSILKKTRKIAKTGSKLRSSFFKRTNRDKTDDNVNVGVYTQARGERGAGLKFAIENFQKVASFAPGTKIKYGPNPKQLGSKSYDRYEGYKHSKTVGESLKNGSTVLDLSWELDRKIYTLVGGERSEAAEIKAIGEKHYKRAVALLASRLGPRGLAFGIKDERAKAQIKLEEAWREARLRKCESLAKQFKLRPEKHVDIKDELGIPESAELRLQRRVADEFSKRKLEEAGKNGRKLAPKDLEEVLELWGYRQNMGRLNVMPKGQKYVYSDTVGMIRRHVHGYGLTTVTERYPNFVKILTRWVRDNVPPPLRSKDFVCTAINLNANYAGRRHRDGNNQGPSIIRAFGKFRGGRLRYYKKDVTPQGKTKPDVETLNSKDAETHDIGKTTLVFDGNRAHEVEDFTGVRYSVVYFSAKGYNKVKPKDQKTLLRLGFPYPTTKTMAALKKKTGSVPVTP